MIQMVVSKYKRSSGKEGRKIGIGCLGGCGSATWALQIAFPANQIDASDSLSAQGLGGRLEAKVTKRVFFRIDF
jgi:hypothetical protein